MHNHILKNLKIDFKRNAEEFSFLYHEKFILQYLQKIECMYDINGYRRLIKYLNHFLFCTIYRKLPQTLIGFFRKIGKKKNTLFSYFFT